MATQISVQILKQELEKQKQQALNCPIQIWCDSNNAAKVNHVCTQYSGILQNPNQFQVHTFSASTNPDNFVQDMAACFPRILIVALADLSDPKVNIWIRQQFPQQAQKIPFADIKFINTKSIVRSDRQYLEQFGTITNPTVLVFKMGHLIDLFAPKIEGPDPSFANPALAEAMRFRKEMMKNVPPPKPVIDVENYSKHDQDKLEWEQQYRLKEAEQRKKEEQAKMAERIKVRAMIEEQRKARQKTPT